MTDRRRLTRRIAGSAAGILLAAAAVGAAVQPWPLIGATGPSDRAPVAPRVDVTPVAAETVLACDGPLLALGRNASDASGLDAATDLSFTMRSSLDEEPASEAAVELPGVASSLVVSQLPEGGDAVSIAAAGSAAADETDMRGFVASACRSASPESWIAGATVATGTTDILTIANPSDVAATVSVSVYGVDGHRTPSNGEIALPPRSQRAIPVASIAGEEQSPVIRVTAEGAPVRTTLQSSRVVTLDPRGVDLQPGTIPATDAVIPRVLVTGSAAESDDDPTQLRLLGTAGVEGSVDVAIVDEATGERVVEQTAQLSPDVPVSVGFDALEPGSYAVRLSGDTPFVAAVRQVAGDDYAWFAPGEPLTAESLASVPAGPDGAFALSFANLGDDPAEVAVEPVSGGDAQSIEIGPGRSTTHVVDDAQTYRVTVVSGRVAGSAGVAADGAIASFPLEPDPAEPEAITVAP
ncbi:DUF5719 family protein [Microbacterium karelineae]|uniref:DUF5719 family protein n=1 Tax=Microbacterium karelineae TaxID=2654283 RepID=UPI0012EA9AB4|nr:DUF5719 family protein [Microbacterium karelineae]